MNVIPRRALAAGLLLFLAASLGAADRERDKDRRRNGSSGTAAPAPAVAASSAIAPGSSFDAFQLVIERNIFNPNRIGRTRATTEEKPPRVEEVSLVGTMDYDKGLVAFFESPDAAYRKTARVGDAVGEFKVQKIAGDGVELSRDSKPMALKVAQQLRRVEGGEWSIRAAPVVIAPPTTADGRPSLAGEAAEAEARRQAEASAASEAPADASEVLKRLLKKREKQLK